MQCNILEINQTNLTGGGNQTRKYNTVYLNGQLNIKYALVELCFTLHYSYGFLCRDGSYSQTCNFNKILHLYNISCSIKDECLLYPTSIAIKEDQYFHKIFLEPKFFLSLVIVYLIGNILSDYVFRLTHFSGHNLTQVVQNVSFLRFVR